ncbi:hypothetical protein LSAT2_028270, partial [Lamellibrachia satsuma]
IDRSTIIVKRPYADLAFPVGWYKHMTKPR